MKKILAVILAVSFLFALASCGSGPDKEEQKYLETAQQYLDDEEYLQAIKTLKEGLELKPESEYLAELLKTAEDSLPPVPAESEVKEKFAEFYNLVMKWYFLGDVCGAVTTSGEEIAPYKHTYPNGYTEEVYPTLVNEPGVTTKNELDDLFLSYCTPESYKEIEKIGPPLGFYDDVDGRLVTSHIMGGAAGRDSFDDKSVTVTKSGDEAFKVSAIRIFDEGDCVAVYKVSCAYSRDTSGKFRFGILSDEEVGVPVNEGTKYKTAAGGSAINLKEFPRESADAVISLTEGQVVTAIGKYGNWIYAKTESDTYGWIKAGLLTEVTSSSSSGRTGGGSNGNNIVNSVVNAGVQIAGGVISSLF